MKKLVSLLIISILCLVSPSQVFATETKSVGVFLINWLDDTTQVITPERTYDEMFVDSTSPNTYYQDTSYGKLQLTGDVLGWYTVNFNKADGCLAGQWAGDAIAQAESRGFNPSSYDIRVFMWTSAGCGWSGYTAGTNVYINHLYTSGHILDQAVAHEIGHTLGVGHANTKLCYDSTGQQIILALNRGEYCQDNTYGDRYDVMGNSSYNTMNAIHRTMLGWLPSENTKVVSTAGTYNIVPLEWNVNDIQQIEVVPATPKGNKYVPFHICLEVRQSYGWDQFNENNQYGNPWATNGIHIHYAPTCSTTPYGAAGGSTYLLDGTPNSSSDPADSPSLNYPLPVGQSMNAEGVKITLLSINSSGASVKVEYPKR